MEPSRLSRLFDLVLAMQDAGLGLEAAQRAYFLERLEPLIEVKEVSPMTCHWILGPWQVARARLLRRYLAGGGVFERLLSTPFRLLSLLKLFG